jgi:hypothetical protein
VRLAHLDLSKLVGIASDEDCRARERKKQESHRFSAETGGSVRVS